MIEINGWVMVAVFVIVLAVFIASHWEHLRNRSMQLAMWEADRLFNDLLKGGKKAEWICHRPDHGFVAAKLSGEIFAVDARGVTTISDPVNGWYFWSYAPHNGGKGFNKTVQWPELEKVQLVRILGIKPGNAG